MERLSHFSFWSLTSFVVLCILAFIFGSVFVRSYPLVFPASARAALEAQAEADEDEAVLSGVRAGASQTMELVRKCMKLAIELIEAEAEGNKSFMEYLHSEPDLILHCQEIETYCNNLLPTKNDEAEVEVEEGEYK